MKRLAVSLLALTACGPSLSYTPAANPSAGAAPVAWAGSIGAPRPVDSVQVFMDVPPDRPVVERGQIESHQDSYVVGFVATLSGQLQKVRAEAAVRGCDAIAFDSGRLLIEGFNDDGRHAGMLVGVGPGRELLARGLRVACLTFTPGAGPTP